jgi:nucleoside-diphosphate-sugar epimerase
MMTDQPKCILVTGAGGFLGFEIAKQLKALGHEVRSFSRNNYSSLDAIAVTQYQGDLANIEDLRPAMKGCDVVFHVAAKAGAWGSTQSYEEINVKGTQNVIDLCLSFGISQLIYTSSPSVVHAGGDIEGLTEADLPYPDHYLADYPRTKAMAEKAVLSSHQPKLATIALRPHLIWGPGDQHLIPRIKQRAEKGKLKHLAFHKKVDSTYIVDAGYAHVCAWQALTKTPEVCGGKAYFISQGEAWAMGDLINGILGAIGIEPVYKEISPKIAYFIGFCLEKIYTLLKREDEPIMTRFVAEQLSTAHWFDISAAKKDLNYHPQYSIASALAELKKHSQS